MLSGVGKSGSPAPKSTTSTPCARSFSASAATFIVDDTLIAEIRLAISVFSVGVMISRANTLGVVGAHAFSQPGFDRGRHQPRDVAAEPDNLLYQTGTNEGVRFTRE